MPRRATLLALALLVAPSATPCDEPAALGRFDLDLGIGGGAVGAPQVLLGAGWAPVETGRLRIEPFLRLGFSETRKFHYDAPSGTAGDASLQAVSLHLDLPIALRIGRFEPFAGGGVAIVGAGGTLDTWCRVELAPACAAGGAPPRTHDTVNGSTIASAVAFGGLRVAVADQWLVAAELRYQREGLSRLDAAPISMPVGGFSGLLYATWRISGAPATAPPTSPAPRMPTGAGPRAGSEAARPPAPSPASPVPPVPPPPAAPPQPKALAVCAPGEIPAIPLRTARSFRCFPDPVRGGHTCEPRAEIGSFVDVEPCESACRGGSAACAESGPAAAACGRCVKGCADTALLPCPADAIWTEGRPACPLPAGRLGLESARTLPATCAPAARER